MSIYFVIFCFILVLMIFENKLTTQSKNFVLVSFAIILILFAGLRDSSVDFDHFSYQTFYKEILSINILFANPSRFFSVIKIEPSLLIIFSIAKSYFLSGLQISIFVYALISVSLKIKAIYKMTDFVLYSLLIYFSGIFLLQDMTQIRAAVAVGFILLSIQKIEEKKHFQYLTYISLAIFFHYSSIVFIPFVFLNSKKIDKLYYVLLIFIPILLCILKLDPIYLFSKMHLGIISEKIGQYINMQRAMKLRINIFNFNILIQIATSLFFVFYSENTKNKYAIILTKINCYGVALFYIFSSIPVIAFRSNELLSSVQIILIPYLIYIIKPKALAEGIVILIATLYIINQLIINPILNPYKLIIFQ